LRPAGRQPPRLRRAVTGLSRIEQGIRTNVGSRRVQRPAFDLERRTKSICRALWLR
jgi:hypothetical protein